jgi:Na+-driven multidrug efflux pump
MKDQLSAAVSSALFLAFLIGSIQSIVFIFGAGPGVELSGIAPSSTMYAPAKAYMRARAFSAPSATLWLVATNIFRGKKVFSFAEIYLAVLRLPLL